MRTTMLLVAAFTFCNTDRADAQFVSKRIGVRVAPVKRVRVPVRVAPVRTPRVIVAKPTVVTKTVVLKNNTESPLTFRISANGEPYKQRTLRPGASCTYSVHSTRHVFRVEYDASASSGVQKRTETLAPGTRNVFRSYGQRIELTSL